MSEPYRLPEVFRTERFVVRRVQDADAEAIFEAYATDAAVARYMSWRPHGDLAETRAYVAACGREWEEGSGFPSVILADGRLVGMIHPRLLERGVSYGYVVRADFWGRGCASEVLGWEVRHALAHPAVFRAEAFCDVENPASARVMEKAGMSREGVLRRFFRHPNLSDEPRDCLMYAAVR